MKKLLLATAFMLAASPAFAKEVIIKEVTGDDGKYYFSPNKMTIQPGDTVTFVNAQDDMHDVMFVDVPKAVDEMIMSPMFEKKGDKYSYTFTVPGTYQFHCHPHEALGMKGTLIVGTPSKPGETKAMDHHKLEKKAEKGGDAQAAAAIKPAAGGVAATGKVISIDGSNIKLDHEAIKQLGWPKMKMTFKVDQGVDLSSLKEGDAVSFTLKEKGKDDYVISNISKQ